MYLYSTGGLTIAGYALVNLFREFYEELNVLIPFKALSTATLIAPGANEIIITKMGQLSPIDPSVQHALGPIAQMPGQPRGRIAPVDLENVNAFIKLAKKELGLDQENSMMNVLQMLASKINPLVLGAVHRSREEIAFLASTLIQYHTNDNERIENCGKVLTRHRFSHECIVSRREAREVLGLNIVEPDEDLTALVVGLFDAYNDIIVVDKPYHPEVFLAGEEVRVADLNRAIIESIDLSHVFRTRREIKRVEVAQPGIPHPVVAHQERLLEEGWVERDTI